MKHVEMRKLTALFSILIAVTFLLRAPIERTLDRWDPLDYKHYAVEEVDDSGYRIKMELYPERIISLHPAHTINLFHLGLEHQIAGVHKKDVFPLAAVDMPRFELGEDAGPILKEKPDLILITPQIERDHPDLVNQLRRSGSRVFSIYPKNFEDMERYIATLGAITGKVNTAVKYYQAFESEQSAMEKSLKPVEVPLRVYYEVDEMNRLSASADSIQAEAMRLAGAELVTLEPEAVHEMTYVADFNRLPKQEEPTQWIFSEEGGYASGGSLHAIEIRDGYNALEAVQNHHIEEVDFRLLGLPSIDLFKGIEATRRILYPDLYLNYEFEEGMAPMKRQVLAEWLVNTKTMWPFYPDYSYFEEADRGHYYGQYEDVPVDHPYFEVIETVVQAGYLKGRFDDDGLEWFDPDQPVTRDAFAMALFLVYDLKTSGQPQNITDIEASEHPRIVSQLVANGVLSLDEYGHFNPQADITYAEALLALIEMERLTHD